ncbi:MAG: hypothetical protein OFPII_00070 [Osedax symbiont Rs1]|nr:MAG: hypothetical protein OFPII_00070 [Osedax symbiont Rs1]
MLLKPLNNTLRGAQSKLRSVFAVFAFLLSITNYSVRIS